MDRSILEAGIAVDSTAGQASSGTLRDFRPALVERHAECAVNGQADECEPGKSLGEDGRVKIFEYLFCCGLQRP